MSVLLNSSCDIRQYSFVPNWWGSQTGAMTSRLKWDYSSRLLSQKIFWLVSRKKTQNQVELIMLTMALLKQLMHSNAAGNGISHACVWHFNTPEKKYLSVLISDIKVDKKICYSLAETVSICKCLKCLPSTQKYHSNQIKMNSNRHVTLQSWHFVLLSKLIIP